MGTVLNKNGSLRAPPGLEALMSSTTINMLNAFHGNNNADNNNNTHDERASKGGEDTNNDSNENNHSDVIIKDSEYSACSTKHHGGECEPCAFYHSKRSCQNGLACHFCH